MGKPPAGERRVLRDSIEFTEGMFRAASIFDAQRWRYSRILTALCTAAAVWVLSALGILSSLSGMVYDQFLRLSVSLGQEPAHVFLVELDEEMPPEEAPDLYLRLVEVLVHLGARNILFTLTPRNASLEFFLTVRRYPQVIFGRRLLVDPYDPELVRVEPIHPEALGLDLTFGVDYVHPGVGGVHRTQSGWYELEGKRYTTLEARVFSDEKVEELLGSSGTYRPRFLGGPGSLPAIQAARIFNGGLIPELVEGKSVIIGEVAGRFDSGLETPTTTEAQRMSRLEFHGHALNTLLSGRVLRETGTMTRLCLLLGLAFVSCILYQWADAVLASWMTMSALLGLFAATYFLYDYSQVWIPVTEITCSQGLLFVIALRHKAALSGAWLRNLLLNAASRLQDRYLPTSPGTHAEYWALIVNMINQTLDLNRLIFLETDRRASRLREIQSLNCSFEDVNESRRDLQRSPYITAIECAGPLRVENYLKKAFDREEQYLVPLIFGKEVLGFWACGVDPAKAAAVPRFEVVLRDYAALISELLYERRQAYKRESWWSRIGAYLSHERGEEVYKQLKATTEIVETRLRQIEQLLASINTAVVAYDLFGRTVHINRGMIELLEDEKLSPRKMTALDLISALSEYDLGRSRKILRHVLIEQQGITVPVSLSTKGDSRYVMHLHPLQLTASEQREDALKELTGKGLLCELMDTTEYTGFFEMKEKLAARLGLQLRNDLASIDLSSSLLSSAVLSEDQRKHIAQIIHDKVARTMDVLVECQQYLMIDTKLQSVERFPVDSQEWFLASLSKLDGALKSRNLTMNVSQPELMSFTLASGGNLELVFSTILKLLIADATDDSSIDVSVSESEDLISYTFKNTGFGIPNERFQKYLFGDAALATEDLKTLREGINWVEGWGGELEAYSEVGVGTWVTLRLVRFI